MRKLVSYFLGRDSGYVLIMLFDDGTKQEIPMPLYEPVPLPGRSRPKE